MLQVIDSFYFVSMIKRSNRIIGIEVNAKLVRCLS